jgi:hypothetical protein
MPPTLEIPTPSDPVGPVVPETPTVPADPVPGPVAPDTPDGPDAPEPNDPLPPGPEGPDVPEPDPEPDPGGDPASRSRPLAPQRAHAATRSSPAEPACPMSRSSTARSSAGWWIGRSPGRSLTVTRSSAGRIVRRAL